MNLTDAERDRYKWQFATTGFGGESGQRKLKAASVLISRSGGVGGAAAWQLAAAGVGRIVLAHAGNVKPSDLNRQTLIDYNSIGKLRVEHAAARLRAFNPHIEIEAVPENISEGNAVRLIETVDLVVDAAPLFEERYAINDAVVQLGKPVIEAAMFDWEMQLTTIIPGRTGCLRCIYPEKPDYWKRKFPVFGAVAATAGAMAAAEVIKLLSGAGQSLASRMFCMDLSSMQTRIFKLAPNPSCPVCKRQSRL